MNNLEAHLVLFASVEGGSVFWTHEVETHGAKEVVQKVIEGGYDLAASEKTISKITSQNSISLRNEIRESGATFLIKEDSGWPKGLNDLSAPPFGLIVKGNIDSISADALAIVGTRNPTNYGVRIAGEFAAGFVDRDWLIISGGAYGIDAAAHRGALIAEGATIAVLASGINVNYPAGHVQLFAELCESGALISEVMPSVSAIPARFLTRNRLIAAISKST